MRSIGEMARVSGLSVSALRFYDGAGLFGPAWVDPQTGYRWYAAEQLPDARLIARLRRVGMPLPDISRVLAGDTGALDTHLCRLEDGLADARRELSAVRIALELRENPMSPTRLTIPAAELAAALDAVRFAVNERLMPADDCGVPASVHGVLLDITADELRVVATDRYRLAVALAPVASVTGPEVAAVAPVTFVDALRELLRDAPAAELVVDGGSLTAEVDGRRLDGDRIELDYPDYRRLTRLEEPAQRVTVRVDDLRERLRTSPARPAVRDQDGIAYDVSVLTVGPDGELTVSDTSAPDGGSVSVNRDFLLDALSAGAQEQLVLELGGPISPLAIRFPGRESTFSLLMPSRP